MTVTRTTALILALAAFALPAAAQEAPPAPAEEGIPWVRDYAAAKAQAAKEGKGLLVYMTPEPGWFT